MSSLDLSDTIQTVADSVGSPTLKPEQEKAIVSFVSENDVFVSLPTCYSKSLCFGLLPRVFDCVTRSGKEEYSASRVSLSFSDERKCCSFLESLLPM